MSRSGSIYLQRGMSLLEVTLAIAIAGTAIAVLAGSAATSFRVHRAATDRLVALSHAESVLAIVEMEAREATEMSGVLNERFRWTARVSSRVTNDTNDAVDFAARYRLVDIVIVIRWQNAGRTNEYELQASRLLPRA